MKLIVPIVLVLSGTAVAEDLTLTPVPTSVKPNVVGSKAVCKAENDFTRVVQTKLDGHEVSVLGDCSGTGYVAFETKNGWSRYKTSPWWGSLTTLKVRKRNIVLNRSDTHESDDRSTSRIDICTYSKDGTPECGSVEVECPETGCKEPEIIKGALWLHAKGGRKRFPIKGL